MIRNPQDINGHYRSSVGIMLLNAQKKILVGQRIDNVLPSWQMPQGGIESNENSEPAARRELLEEVGTNNVALLATINDWLYYDLPPELAAKTWQGRYKGQRQKWFAFKFLGHDDEINVQTAQPEFNDWRWFTPDELVEHAICFKQNLYRYLISELYDKLTKF